MKNRKNRKNKNQAARDQRKKNCESTYHNSNLSIYTLPSVDHQDLEDSEEPIVITVLPGSAYIPEIYQNLANNFQRSVKIVRGSWECLK